MRRVEMFPAWIGAVLCAVGCASVPGPALEGMPVATVEIPDSLDFETAGTYAAYSDAVLAARDGDLEQAIVILENLSAFGDPASVDIHLTLGRYYRRSGETRKALERARLAARLDPARAGAHRMEATCLLDMEAYGLAVAPLERLLVLEPHDLPSRLKLSRIFNGLGKSTEALKLLDEGHRMAPENRSLLVARIEAIATQSGPQAALDFVESLEPGDFIVDVIHADLLVELQRREDAIDEYEALLVADPHRSDLREKRAALLSAVGRPDEAVSEMELALRSGRLGPGSNFDLALYLADAGRFDEARLLLADLVEQEPDNAFYREALAGVLLDLDDVDGAIHLFRRVISADPLRESSWVGLGMLELNRDRDGAARNVLERASVFLPESAVVAYLLGVAFRQEGLMDEGIAQLARSIELGLEEEDVFFELGMAREASSDFEGAVEAFRRVLGLNPENAAALNYIGYMYAERGIHLEEAETLILRALETEPKNGYFIDSLGWTYFQMGRYEEAFEELSRALEFAPDDETIYEHLGDTLRALGRFDDARGAYRDALALDPENPVLLRKAGGMDL